MEKDDQSILFPGVSTINIDCMCPIGLFSQLRPEREGSRSWEKRGKSLYSPVRDILQLPELPSFYLLCFAEGSKPTLLCMSLVGRYRYENTNTERNLIGEPSVYFITSSFYAGSQLQKYIVYDRSGQCNHTKAICNEIKLVSYSASTMEEDDSAILRGKKLILLLWQYML